MPEEKNFTIEAHKKFAVELFNRTWELYDKKDRNKLEEDEMLHAAHASAYHWSKLQDVVDDLRYKKSYARAEHLLSRVNWVLQRDQACLIHAKRTLEFCEEHRMGDYDLAFAYEALARAYSMTDNTAERDAYIELAKKATQDIEKKEDKDFFLSELASVPGYK